MAIDVVGAHCVLGRRVPKYEIGPGCSIGPGGASPAVTACGECENKAGDAPPDLDPGEESSGDACMVCGRRLDAGDESSGDACMVCGRR